MQMMLTEAIAID